ncbi:MAG: universal stress protein [Planctomycetes bacterium]|nr:universal stress protein [Planctomycetota bacterium]
MEEVSFRILLCPMDFSECCDYALRYAISVAQAYRARLALLHVVELPLLPSYTIAGLPELNLPVEKLQIEARKLLNARAEEIRRLHTNVTSEIRAGTAFVEITSYAEQINADLVIMGMHGGGGLRDLLIGSVAEKVVRKAPCPVMVVKKPLDESG